MGNYEQELTATLAGILGPLQVIPLHTVHDRRASSYSYLLPVYGANGHTDSMVFGPRIRHDDFLGWLLGRFSHDTLVWK